jgi:hypothetical protein
MQITLYSRGGLTGEPKNIDGVVFRIFREGTENDLPVDLEELVDTEEAAFVFADDELQIGDVIKMDDRCYAKTHGQWIEVNKLCGQTE